MKPKTIRFGAILAGCGLAGLLVSLVLSVPHHPVALLRVVDVAGKPIAGVVIHPEGLRTKSGPYRSGWYSWQPEKNGVPDNPVTSDAQGYARVPYPKYVLEHLETGVLCLSVEDARFVPDRPEVDVNFAPPAGAPWRAWGEYILARLQHKRPVTQTIPIVLNQGATLLLSVKPGTPWVTNAPLFAQISGLITAEDTNFWNRPTAGVLVTHCLRPGREVVRVIQFDPNPKGPTWFSPAMVINAVAGKTNEVAVELTPGVSVHGQAG